MEPDIFSVKDMLSLCNKPATTTPTKQKIIHQFANYQNTLEKSVQRRQDERADVEACNKKDDEMQNVLLQNVLNQNDESETNDEQNISPLNLSSTFDAIVNAQDISPDLNGNEICAEISNRLNKIATDSNDTAEAFEKRYKNINAQANEVSNSKKRSLKEHLQEQKDDDQQANKPKNKKRKLMNQKRRKKTQSAYFKHCKSFKCQNYNVKPKTVPNMSHEEMLLVAKDKVPGWTLVKFYKLLIYVTEWIQKIEKELSDENKSYKKLKLIKDKKKITIKNRNAHIPERDGELTEHRDENGNCYWSYTKYEYAEYTVPTVLMYSHCKFCGEDLTLTPGSRECDKCTSWICKFCYRKHKKKSQTKDGLLYFCWSTYCQKAKDQYDEEHKDNGNDN